MTWTRPSASVSKPHARVAVFQTPDDEGTSVSPERLKRDLERELSLSGSD